MLETLILELLKFTPSARLIEAQALPRKNMPLEYFSFQLASVVDLQQPGTLPIELCAKINSGLIELGD
ncbi:MAG: hypothetical protein NTW15_00505 [Burkholderiales bacterium]|nr:hypothetical protein [Burkholderiales bacterium]